MGYRQKESEGGYLESAKHGPWITWWPNGHRQSEGVYDEGVKTGDWMYWTSSGALTGGTTMRKRPMSPFGSGRLRMGAAFALPE